ncbi:hypothetical protein UlMin_027639 [Ulmus minor]
MNRRDNSNYCRYHCDTGHTTEECRTLKDEVERLIQRGQLKEYGRGANQQPCQPVEPARPPPHDNQDIETEPFLHQINLTRHKDKIPHLSNDPIIFIKDEARGLWHPHKDSIVVTLCIARQKVYRILIDNGSSVDILFKSTLNRINLIGAKIEPTTSSLSGFTRDSVSSKGILNLPVELGTSPCQHIHSMEFVIVDCPSLYNTIISRPTLNQIQAITSTYHLLVKFPTIGGIGVLKGNQLESREIYEAANKLANVQGIRNLTKSCDKTMTANTLEESKSSNTFEKFTSVGDHTVNIIHSGDGVHNTTDIHNANNIRNLN